MGRYIVRRLLETIPLLLIISIFVFMFIHLLPGDPARQMAGLEAPPEEVEAIREEFGLNKPLLVQYFDYMKGLFTGNMGRSLKSKTPVAEMIGSRFPYTLQLVFAGLLWGPILGILIGVICAIKRGTWADMTGMLIAICGLSAPGFVLGLVGIQFFSVQLGLFPTSGLESWKSFILPSVVMGTGIMATLARYSRSSMLETLREDYVRTARALRLRDHGDHFLHPRHGPAADGLHPVPRLPCDPGAPDDIRGGIRDDQSHRRRPVRRHQSEDPF